MTRTKERNFIKKFKQLNPFKHNFQKTSNLTDSMLQVTIPVTCQPDYFQLRILWPFSA